MSFDLRLREGELVIGPNGDFEVVRNTDKLIQDVLIILNTPIGSDPFNPTLGTYLTADLIGTIPNQTILQRKMEESVTDSVEQLISMQIAQEAMQFVSPQEKIVGVKNLSIFRDEQDPRQFNIFLDITSEGEPEVQIPQFSINIFA